jgi:protein-tyrosine phosphatase
MGCDNNADLIITDNGNTIWLGNYHSALDFNFLKNNNINVVINCTKEIPFIYELSDIPLHLETVRIPLYDTPNVEDNKMLYNHLKKTIEFLNLKFFKEHKNILIHCAAGKSRSASVLAAFLFYNIINRDNITSDKGKLTISNSNSQIMNNVIKHIIKRRQCAFYYGKKFNFQNALQAYFNITF